jgi:hypothetical protein
MTTLLTLLLASTATDLANLDFGDGKLTHWKGSGFHVVNGVASKDDERGARKGLLHRTFVVPPGAGTLHVTAYASVEDEKLNIYLEAAEREIVPKYVRTDKGFEKSPKLHPAAQGKPREYVWSLADRVGETLRILIVDQCGEPGRHVYCSGFRIDAINEHDTREFKKSMASLVREHKLPVMRDPIESKHFLAIGNTDETFIKVQLEQCEMMYQMFLVHFREKGFKLQKPATRLMIAVFSSQEGFEAYLGHRIPSAITGIYHPPTNRLIVYDFGRNRALVESKKRFEERVRELSDQERWHLLTRLDREANEIRADTNLVTIMHEAAHQMSFNTGLLNREGDLPAWLVEGIATHCEATERGFWQGIGAMNSERLRVLRRAAKGQEEYLSLRSVIENDRWLRNPGGTERIVMGYSQSWALVRMLIEEQPKAFRRYVELIGSRRTPDYRLTDFVEVFGTDLVKLERRHREYIKQLVETNP